MPFDPTKPVNGAAVLSAELRAQFISLKALIDAQAATNASQSAVIAALENQNAFPACPATRRSGRRPTS